MTIEDFLQEYVEGYLFHDLESMSSITLPPSQKYGAAGYPMVISTLAGMELLGGLLSVTSFRTDSGAGNHYFKEYWDYYLVPSVRQYAPYRDVFRKLLRHGLMHTFLAKSGISVTKGNPPAHLHSDGQGGFYVDANQLYLDFRQSYLTQVQPVVLGTHHSPRTTKVKIQDRLNEMLKTYQAEAAAELSKLPAGTPPPLSLLSATFVANVTASISPAPNLRQGPAGPTPKR